MSQYYFRLFAPTISRAKYPGKVRYKECFDSRMHHAPLSRIIKHAPVTNSTKMTNGKDQSISTHERVYFGLSPDTDSNGYNTTDFSFHHSLVRNNQTGILCKASFQRIYLARTGTLLSKRMSMQGRDIRLFEVLERSMVTDAEAKFTHNDLMAENPRGILLS